MKLLLRQNQQIRHPITSKNASNLTHASTDDLHAEMIPLKSFVVDQMCMLNIYMYDYICIYAYIITLSLS